jgi:hypothetical protein
MKRRPTYVNGITSGALACLRIPATFSSDRQCLDSIWSTTGRLDSSETTYCWIRNTQDLTTIAVSANLLPPLLANPDVEILSTPTDLTFDDSGDLVDALA